MDTSFGYPSLDIQSGDGDGIQNEQLFFSSSRLPIHSLRLQAASPFPHGGRNTGPPILESWAARHGHGLFNGLETPKNREMCNMLENTLRHLHLLPGTDSSYYCQRPENKKADSTCSGFITPLPSADFYVHRILHLVKNNVQYGRHSNPFAPPFHLSDLQQGAAISGLNLLALKTLSPKPILG